MDARPLPHGPARLVRVAISVGLPNWRRLLTRPLPTRSRPGGPKRMVWKMSIDLSRPLVSSMGQHDPLDGLITCLELQTAEGFEAEDGADLTAAIADMTEMCAQARWATDDPLGIGGLLDDATRLAQLVFERGVERHELLHQLLVEAELSLRVVWPLLSPRSFRRASPGISGAWPVDRHPRAATAQALGRAGPRIGCRQRPPAAVPATCRTDLRPSGPIRRIDSAALGSDHRDINTVMLATSLAPEGYLQL